MFTYARFALLTDELLEKEFDTSFSKGLTAVQVLEKRKRFGPNAIKETGGSWLTLLLRQFNSPFMYLLGGAGLLAFFLESKINAIIIFIILFINGLLSFFQEYRAEQALKLLKAHLTMTTTVLRDGKLLQIDSEELVPGDIIILQPGSMIPADVRFINGSVSVDESSLTGEYSPAKKISTASAKEPTSIYDADNLGFLGTTVTSGSAHALIIATGGATLFGAISELTLQTVRHSSFEQRLFKLSTFILAVIVITLSALFVFHLIIKGFQTDIIELLLFCLALTLGLTPEALPTVTTFALSKGALQLARHNVVVKRLSAIEDLGAITILCTDKTGTLTENKLSVAHFLEKDHQLPVFLLLASKKDSHDAFDTASWAASSDHAKETEKEYERVLEIPFDPVRRRNLVVAKKDSAILLITRGSYEDIIRLVSTPPNKEELQTWTVDEAQQGNRVLAIAYKQISSPENVDSQMSGFTFAGLVSFQDPIKSTTSVAVTKAHKLGLQIKMITGDSKEVACSVALQIGLVKSTECALSGTEFEALSPEEKETAVHAYNVFARILPEQKYEIVNLLKPNNVVGFLGDGMNDAPALKTAHVALAVQGATDIAKDAADVILLKKSLLVIVEGIAIGRNVFSNTIKYIVASLSSNSGNFYSVAIASLFIDFLPLLPLQILLLNLLSDFPMVSIATDTVDADDLKKPQHYNLREIAFIALILGLVSSVFDFIFFALFLPLGPQGLQTNWFVESIFTELALIYSIRTKKIFFKGRRPSLILLILSFVSAAITLLLPWTHWGREFFHFQPLTLPNLLTIAVIVISYFCSTELVKLLYVRLTTTGKPQRS